ncbi:flavin reductase family protein [Rhizobium panacihumi]|uniref:flavin reductase family protein n=1 Tax=Rhizobium panacihumi TaxID=2008450 RepID=UPI003D7B3B7E
MFYSTDENRHGLAHDPFKAIVSPRPIGWIGTKGRDGSLNLSPYSFFNAICDNPKLVMFSSSSPKDSLRNARETGVFTASLASRHLAEQMNASSISVEYGVDEFAIAGLAAKAGTLVDAPFVAEAYAALECRVTEIIEPKTIDGGKAEAIIVFGQVVGIHLSEEILREGRVDMGIARPLGRMGYRDYADSGADVFEMTRPSTPKG